MLKNSELGKGFSRFLGSVFKSIPIHPNIITASAIVFAFIGYITYPFYYAGWFSLVFFFLAFFVDALDGAIARAKNMETRKGAFLDGICDRLVEFFLILVLFNAAIPLLILEKYYWLLIVLFFGTGMTSFVKAYADHTGAIHHARAIKMSGMLERAGRVILLMLIFVLTLIGNDFSAVVLMFTAMLCFFTFVERLLFVLGSNN